MLLEDKVVAALPHTIVPGDAAFDVVQLKPPLARGFTQNIPATFGVGPFVGDGVATVGNFVGASVGRSAGVGACAEWGKGERKWKWT
jgi:hypothetical protein